jgi:hypothetical protein
MEAARQQAEGKTSRPASSGYSVGALYCARNPPSTTGARLAAVQKRDGIRGARDEARRHL